MAPGDCDATCAVREIEFHHFGFPLNARFVRVPHVPIIARARAFARLAVVLHFSVPSDLALRTARGILACDLVAWVVLL